jgi:acetate kinase
VFTGGLGEHLPRLRQDLMAHFAWMGLKVDPARNAAAQGDCPISPEGAPIPILRIEAREDLVMARQVFGILALQRKAAEEREKRKKSNQR